MRKRIRRAIFFGMMMLTGGCVTTPKNPPAKVDLSNEFSEPAPVDAGAAAQVQQGTPASPDAIIPADVAAGRLQDIGGYILLYYRDHQQMPASLEDLKAGIGGDLDITSPSTGQPFVYYANGIWSSDKKDKCIIAHDPVAGRNGKRWCLFMSMPKAGAALSVDVVDIPEGMFREYR